MMGRKGTSNAYKLEAVERAKLGDNSTDQMIALYYYLDDNAKDLAKPEFLEHLEDYLDLIARRNPDGTYDYSHAAMLLLNFEAGEKLALLESDIARMDISRRDKGYLWLNQFLVREYSRRNNWAEAEKAAKAGLQTARERNESPYILEYLKILSGIYEQSGQFEKAVVHLNEYHTMKDSLFTSQVMANLDSLNVAYETARREKQIAGQELRLQQSRNVRTLLLVLLVTLLLLSGLTFWYIWNRNKLNHELTRQEVRLKEQQIEKLEQEKKLLAMSSMIEGQEEERMRIARDLHDGLGGLLSTIKTRFSTISAEIDALESMDVYKKVDDLINTASEEVRRISHNMAPQAIRLGHLKDALQDLASQLRHPGLNVHFEWTGDEDELPENVSIMLYRIAQELANNVVKHAGAQHLMVQVNRYTDQINLIVEDDGKGFDVEEALRSDGLGMKSVRSRIAYMNGEIDIHSNPGRGTTVSVQLTI